MSTVTSLLWFQQDLRLSDHPALEKAFAEGGAVVPVFVLDVAREGAWFPGAASRWWLHHSLLALEAALAKRGARLVVRKGDAATVLCSLAAELGAGAVFWSARCEPGPFVDDQRVARSLTAQGLRAERSNAALLFKPGQVLNRQGGPFQVFTPFWRRCLELPIAPPSSRTVPAQWPAPSRWPRSDGVASLGFLPTLGWADAWSGFWQPGEGGAAAALGRFVEAGLESYDEGRDFPAQEGVSRLSPHLHFGEIGPRQLWSRLRSRHRETDVFPASKGEQRFLAELGWREFAHQLLHHFPHTPERPLRPEFEGFPWAKDPGGRLLKAWQSGRTGYPIVDAGMRQLWNTGWMHNRVRMIVASFLVKHLRLPWSEGARWFWDTLVDADLANNTLGWQWSAGCGADAAPYFRIFNPVLQGEKFDPEGRYVKAWVPELARLPARFVHRPWEAPPALLAEAGLRLGTHYPAPIVDHAQARRAALEAFGRLKTGA